jgi:hypothetical protein
MVWLLKTTAEEMPAMARGKCRDGRRNNRPPAEFRFQKGKSGNQKGRPGRPPPTLVDLVAAELNSKHFLDAGDGQVEVPFKVVMIRQVMRLACKGNPKALLWVLEMIELVQRNETNQHASESMTSSITREQVSKMTEQERVDLYMKSLREMGR